MKAVSLFAGVGGFDLALERNGVEIVASVEIDKHARAVLARQFPKSQLMEDVCDVTGDQLFRCGFESNGIIVGGFPCQDLSVAGKRRGLAGGRSGLFWEICRLLDETKAKWFVLENVPGLLSSNGGRDLGTVIEALVERGYGVAYRVLDAQYFGVPQRRKRIFIVGCLGNDGSAPAEILAIAEGYAGYLESSKQKRENTSTNSSVSDRIVTFAKSRRAQNPDDHESWIEGAVAPTLNQFENTNDARATVVVFEDNRRNGIRVQGETSPTLQSFMGTGGNNTPMVGSKGTVRRITPIEAERLQGFPDDWTLGGSDSQRYKQMGNAVAVPVAEWIIERLVNADV